MEAQVAGNNVLPSAGMHWPFPFLRAMLWGIT